MLMCHVIGVAVIDSLGTSIATIGALLYSGCDAENASWSWEPKIAIAWSVWLWLVSLILFRLKRMIVNVAWLNEPPQEQDDDLETYTMLE